MEPTVKPKRGLSALLASTTNVTPAQVQHGGEPKALNVPSPVSTGDISIAAIRPNPHQPRTHFDPEQLAELAASIRARGLIQPVVLRQLKPEEIQGEHRYELIAGERRWRASQLAGLTAIPAVIKQLFDAREILLVSLVENLQRDDLNPIEEALAYQRLAATFNLTHEQIAEGVGKSRAAVTNMIRILDLPSTVQDALKFKTLSLGHAKVLLSIPDPKLQAQIAAKVQAENLTVKELERLIAWEKTTATSSPMQAGSVGRPNRVSRVAPPHLQDIEHRLREHFGTKVSVEEGAHKGRIIVEFYSVEDFDRVVKIMGLVT